MLARQAADEAYLSHLLVVGVATVVATDALIHRLDHVLVLPEESPKIDENPDLLKNLFMSFLQN